MHMMQLPQSPEDKMGFLISIFTFFLNTFASVLTNRVSEEHDPAYMYIKCSLYVAHFTLITLAGFHEPELPWKTFSTQYLLFTCCLLPFSCLFYLEAHYGPSMDRMRSIARTLTTSLINTLGIRIVKLPAEAQAPLDHTAESQAPHDDTELQYSIQLITRAMLAWYSLSAVFILALLPHPTAQPDLESLADLSSFAHFLMARFWSPFVVPDLSSWGIRSLCKLAALPNMFWKLAVVYSFVFVIYGPDLLSGDRTSYHPFLHGASYFSRVFSGLWTQTPSGPEDTYDINKEQWVIDLRAKASAEEATRRALKSAKSQMAWYSAAYDAQRLQLDQHANTIDTQQKTLRTVVTTRERQSQTLASVKTQLAALEEKDKASTKLKAQFIGEKQHLLDALTNSQHAVRGANGTLRLRDLELDTLKKELASHKVQQSIAEDKKTFSATLEVYNAKRLADALKQVAAIKSQLETSESTSAQHLKYAKNLNARLDVVNKAMLQAGMPCNPYIITMEDLIARLTLPKYSDVQQEAKLAESCAELSAANETLKRDLSASESKLAGTSACLETSKTETETAKTELKSAINKHHLAFQDWQKELCKAAHALSSAKLATPTLSLKNQTAALQTKLDTALDDNKKSRDLLTHQKYKANEYSYLLTEQMQKTKEARDCLDRCVRMNSELRETLEVRNERVKDLEKRGEAADEDRHAHLKEIQRLAGLLQVQEDAVVALEQTNEKLEKELVLGEEFDKIAGWNLPLSLGVERECQEEEDGVVVWEEDGQDFGESFVEGYKSFEEEFEEVDVEEACEEGSESGDGAPDVSVQ
jgi:hypothetical protein